MLGGRCFSLATLLVAGIARSASILTLAASALLDVRVFAMQTPHHESHQQKPLPILNSGTSGFVELSSSRTGVFFTNQLSEYRSLTNQIFLNGSGVAAGDIDGDGLCDLFFCGLDSKNALYKNLGGWRFQNITDVSGAVCGQQASTGAAFADLDGDGDLDLLVNGIASGTRVFNNDGKGRFQETTKEAGVGGTAGSASLALADVDGDGDLDLYVVNYRNDTMRDMPDIRFRFGVTNGVSQLLSVNGVSASAPEYAGRFTFDRAYGVLENGESDSLFLNDGHARFSAVSWTNGAFLDEQGMPARRPYDWGLSAMFRDMNRDGAPDLYVCNDFQSPDRLWFNDGRGNFRAAPLVALRQTSLFSMGVDFADIDRDGLDDFFVADMLSREHARRQVQVMETTAFVQVRQNQTAQPQFSRNTLFRNRGNQTYAEMAQFAGLEASDWSWCPVFLDVDLDGFEDLLITTGHWRDAQNADVSRALDEEKRRRPMSPLEQLLERRRFPRLDTPNAAFRNRGDLTFEDSSAAWGFDSRRVSHGMALADLDNDGDLDVIINCLNAEPLLLRNENSKPRISIRLRGQPPNTGGVGARVEVEVPEAPLQSQEMIAGGRYLSSDECVRVFAAINATNKVNIKVLWRSGRQSWVTNAAANTAWVIHEHAGPAPSRFPASAATTLGLIGPPPLGEVTKTNAPFFENLSHRLNHKHVDEPYDDFAKQPLLPRKLSELGPGVSWFDMNGDGWDDLFVGTGRGGNLGVFRNDRQGGFVRQRAAPLEAPMSTDTAALLAWRPNPTNSVLLIGHMNDESSATNVPAFRQFSMVSGDSENHFTPDSLRTGPLALGDSDADGDLDLFLGGRLIPGRYPEPASSAVFRNEGGALKYDSESSRAFSGLGMVSDALFTDLDGDGRPELVIACDWGPICLFRVHQGRFSIWDPPLKWENTTVPIHSSLSVKSLKGWWNSIASGDFDNDGRLDLIAGNWGRNNARQRYLKSPIRAHYGDSDGSGHLGILESHHDPALKAYVPGRDLSVLGAVFPTLRERFATFALFGKATSHELLAAGLPPMREASITTMDSLLLLNRGDHFEARSLPLEAQLSPIFGVAIGDFDGDGNEDVFAAQNFFGVSPAESRQDAGSGLWMRGDGRGRLASVSVVESGLQILGEGRGAALCDFDHDGRLDIAIGQHRGATTLFRNARGRPGLRVSLRGTPENPQAIGTRVRLRLNRDQNGSGPVKELRLGGGYWSQDSTDLVLGLPPHAVALEILWPGGTVERIPLPGGTNLITRNAPLKLGGQ